MGDGQQMLDVLPGEALSPRARLRLSPRETETPCLDQVMFGATVSKCRPCSSETLGKVKKGVALTPRPLPLGIPALGDVGAWRQCWDSCHRPCSSTCWPGPASWKLPTVCQQPGQSVPKDYPGSVFPDLQEGHSPARDSQLQSSLALFRQTQLLTKHLLRVPEPWGGGGN